MARLFVVDKSQIGFMHQGGGLQRLPGVLLSHFLGGESAQLVVDQRQKLFRGVRISLFDGRQNASYIGHDRRSYRICCAIAFVEFRGEVTRIQPMRCAAWALVSPCR